MKIKSIIAALLMGCLFVPAHSFAQEDEVTYLTEKENDLRLRTGLEFEKKLPRKFSIKFGEEFRLKESFTEVDRIHSEVDFSYDPFKWLKVSAVYRFTAIDHDGKKKTDFKKYWDLRHRMSFNVALIYRTCYNWKFSLKERVQSTFMSKHKYDPREKNSPMWVLRTKLQADYKFRHLPLAPFTYVELCNTLNAPELANGNYINKMRAALGMEYRFNRRSSMELVYIFDYDLNKNVNVKNSTGELKSITDEKEFNHIISVSYKYRF